MIPTRWLRRPGIARPVRTIGMVVLTFGLLATAPRAALAFDPNDPYDSGCVSSAYIANSAGLFDKAGNRLMTIQNWYSTGCKTNWSLAYNYAVQSSLVTAHDLFAPHQLQCEPTSCALGAGIASPMWTDMVDGTKMVEACGVARALAANRGCAPGASAGRA